MDATNALIGLTHGNVTNLEKGVINNADAALLVLNALGGVAHHRAIRKELRKWRPNRLYSYLFQRYYGFGGYGFTGDNFYTAAVSVYHDPTNFSGKGHYSLRRTYWYRSAHGTYSLTQEGLKRLSELGAK